jgi:hypothetical protein
VHEIWAPGSRSDRRHNGNNLFFAHRQTRHGVLAELFSVFPQRPTQAEVPHMFRSNGTRQGKWRRRPVGVPGGKASPSHRGGVTSRARSCRPSVRALGRPDRRRCPRSTRGAARRPPHRPATRARWEVLRWPLYNKGVANGTSGPCFAQVAWGRTCGGTAMTVAGVGVHQGHTQGRPLQERTRRQSCAGGRPCN